MFNDCGLCIGATFSFACECEFYPPPINSTCPGFEYDDSMDGWDDWGQSEKYVQHEIAHTYEYIDCMDIHGFNDGPTEGELAQAHYDRWYGRRQDKYR